jgi:hypothetical protein
MRERATRRAAPVDGGGDSRRSGADAGGASGAAGSDKASDGHGGGATTSRADASSFDLLSLMEPHKLFQNSFSILQKRGDGWSEPIYTKYP